jgi:hypothetical protein
MALTTLAVLAGWASPAAAHTVGGIDTTNYQTTIDSITPPVEGLSVRVIDNGDRLQLSNRTRREVIVEGYDGEPYLRVGRQGVFENRRSPATYLNRTRRGTGPVPKGADPTAPPEWRRIGSGTTVRWHDHRAHWMGRFNPPAVRRAPGTQHRIQSFAIVLHVDDEAVRVHGAVRWIPGPSPWPWIAVAIVVAVGTVLAARSARAPLIVGGVMVLTLAGIVLHAVGSWTVATNSTAARIVDALPTALAVALGVVALMRLRAKRVTGAAPLLVFAGLFVGIAIGLADVSALSHSQLPTDLSPVVDRSTIALALGGGFGVAGAAALHVRDQPSPHGFARRRVALPESRCRT